MNIGDLLAQAEPRSMNLDPQQVLLAGQRRHRAQRFRTGLLATSAAVALVAAVGVGSHLWAGTTTVNPAAHSQKALTKASSPEEVARAYLVAAKDGDCDLTRRLTLGHTWPWCSDPKLIDYRDVKVFSGLQTQGPGGPPVQAVTFEINTSGSSDTSMSAGWGPWTFLLTHGPDGWRLYDQGPV